MVWSKNCPFFFFATPHRFQYLSSPTGVKPVPPTMEAQSQPLTTREVSSLGLSIYFFYLV